MWSALKAHCHSYDPSAAAHLAEKLAARIFRPAVQTTDFFLAEWEALYEVVLSLDYLTDVPHDPKFGVLPMFLALAPVLKASSTTRSS